MLLAYKKKLLPGNLHLETLNPDIPALHDGRLEVVTKNTEWEGGLAAVSSFGFGGLNVHVLLSPPEDSQKVSHTVMSLTLTSGRTEESVKRLMAVAESNGTHLAVQALVTEAVVENASMHPVRGYTIVNSNKEMHEKQVRLFSFVLFNNM